MIKANAHKYGVSALCKVLNVSRSTYYYGAKIKPDETELTAAVVDIFKISRNNYGTRKIKKELAKQDMVVSRRKIGRITKQKGLVSSYQAFQTVHGSLEDIHIFHTDRGNEFKSHLNDETLEAFEIERSLSHKGCPYDNAVAEAIFKIIKTEFVRNRSFHDLYHLQLQLSDYVNWFNYHRIHSSLDYMTPVEYRENTLKKVV